MAFAAQTNQVPLTILPLMLAVICWTVVFDTYYAIVDREDDLKIGVKSTAILFGGYDLVIIGGFQLLTILLLASNGLLFNLGGWYYLAVVVVAGLFIQEQWSTRSREPNACFAAFMHNRWVGVTLFAGIVLDYMQ